MSIALPACSNCGAALSEDDLDDRRRSVKCRYCGSSTLLPPEKGASAPTPAARPSAISSPGDAVRPKTPRPESISFSEEGDGIRLTYRWFSPVLFFLLFFCIAWDSFLIAWYSMGIGGGGPPGVMGLIFFVFPIAHVAVGLGLSYFVIAGFLNRTWIEVSPSELSVRHGPVPWRGNKSLAVDQLDQLWCSVDAGKRDTNSVSGGTHSFSVAALLKDGRKEKLISMLHTEEEARFIERTIEDFLGLEHHPVAGELV